MLYCDTVIPGEINMLSLGDGRDMYAVRCRDADEYRRALALIKAQRIENIIVDTDPKNMQQLGRAVSIFLDKSNLRR